MIIGSNKIIGIIIIIDIFVKTDNAIIIIRIIVGSAIALLPL